MEERLSVSWDFLFTRWKRIVFGVLVGFIWAGVAFLMAPTKWEAVTLIQIGQIKQINPVDPAESTEPVGQTGRGKLHLPIEAIPVILERMSGPSFIEAAVQRAGLPDAKEQLLSGQYGGEGGLIVRSVRDTDLISIKLQAQSPEMAKQLLEGVVAEIEARHARVMTPMLQYSQAALVGLRSQLEDEKKKLAEFTSRIALTGDKGDDVRSYGLVLAWLFNDGMVNQHERQIMVGEEVLMEPNTRPTRAIEPIVVGKGPASPRPPQFIALGLVLGGMISALLLIWSWFQRASVAVSDRHSSGDAEEPS